MEVSRLLRWSLLAALGAPVGPIEATHASNVHWIRSEDLTRVSQVAKQAAQFVGNLAGYLEEDDLFGLVTANAAMEKLIFGSAIAFEPSEAQAYGKQAFCPFAFHCTPGAPQTCEKIDIAETHNYLVDFDWYAGVKETTEANETGWKDGVWTKPYFVPHGSALVMTYAYPIRKNERFVGIATVDIKLDRLCSGEPCLEHVQQMEVVNKTLEILFVLSLFVSLLSMVWTLASRRHFAFLVAQPGVLLLISIGMTLSSVTIHLIRGEDTVASYCMLQPLFFSFGFLLTVTPMVIKLWRISIIMQIKGFLDRRRAQEVDRTTLRPLPAVLFLSGLVVCIWMQVEPLQYHSEEGLLWGSCFQGHAKTFLVLLGCLHLIVLLAGLHFSYKTRNVSRLLGESGVFSLTLVLNLQLLFIGTFVVGLVSGDRPMRAFVEASIVTSNVLTTFAFVFLPKIYLQCSGDYPDQSQDTLSSTLVATHKQSSRRSIQPMQFRDDDPTGTPLPIELNSATSSYYARKWFAFNFGLRTTQNRQNQAHNKDKT